VRQGLQSLNPALDTCSVVVGFYSELIVTLSLVELMAVRRDFKLLLIFVALLNGETIFASERPDLSTDNHVLCNHYLAR